MCGPDFSAWIGDLRTVLLLGMGLQLFVYIICLAEAKGLGNVPPS